jgi:hypothetical protein
MSPDWMAPESFARDAAMLLKTVVSCAATPLLELGLDVALRLVDRLVLGLDLVVAATARRNGHEQDGSPPNALHACAPTCR